MKGAARRAWLKKARSRLFELRDQLENFAKVTSSQPSPAPPCPACGGDGLFRERKIEP